MKSNQEVKGFSKPNVEGLKKLSIDDRLKRIVDKYKNKKPSKEYIKNIKSQSYYQLECVKCKTSNRKWLEKGKDAYRCPIRMDEIKTGRGIKIFYWCSNCKVSWRG